MVVQTNYRLIVYSSCINSISYNTGYRFMGLPAYGIKSRRRGEVVAVRNKKKRKRLITGSFPWTQDHLIPIDSC